MGFKSDFWDCFFCMLRTRKVAFSVGRVRPAYFRSTSAIV